ncbi:MAG: hypothetical protein KBB70_02200 [Candidatus Pacebacteria bacterium]|nr:hypothetical protein [Candidatus Paceibacterota bacterium]
MKTETNLHLLQQKSWQFYKRAIYLVATIDIIILIICGTSYVANAQSWQPLPGGPLNDDVSSITTFGGYTWVGGNFTTAGSITAQYVARHDGYSWIPTDTLPSPPLGFCTFNNELYALGGFNIDTCRYGMMKWTGSSWMPIGKLSTYFGNSYMKTATVFNGQMIIGGRFLSVNGVNIEYLAKWDGVNWSAFPGSVSCSWQSQPSINDVYASGGYIYVSGVFDQVCGQVAFCCAKWNGMSWIPLNIGIGIYANKCTSYNSSVYVAGGFPSAGGATSQAVAQNIGGGWQSVGNGAKIFGLTSAAYQGKLYVAGQKSLGSGDQVGNCGYWNGSIWVPDNTGIFAGGYESISTLYTDSLSGIMYAGGAFTTSNGNIANNIAYKGEVSLPVELTLFTCEVEKTPEQNVKIKWETATETNADYFDLSVSLDALSWNTIGNIPAYGNSTQLREYSYVYNVSNELAQHETIIYFKLEQHDWDGVLAGVWYEAVSIPTKKQITYNSFSHVLSCEMCSENISIFRSSGELVENIRAPICLDSYASGVYIAREVSKNSESNKANFLRFIVP